MLKKKFAFIGHNVTYDTALFIQERLTEIAKVEADFFVKDIKPVEFDYCMPDMNDLDGYMVLVPYKQQIMQYMDKLSRKSRLYKSVDVVKNSNLVEGHTTTALAFLKALEKYGIKLQGRIAICGMGAIAKILAFECAIKGARTCLLTDGKRLAEASRLSGEIRDSFQNWSVDTCLIDSVDEPIDILVNTVENQGNKLLLPNNVLEKSKYFLDINTNSKDSKLQRKAKACGGTNISSLYMLICQCALSNQIWNNYSFSNDELERVFEETKNWQKANMV